MKLMTELGELPLPDDFSFTMENTNPLLSDAGDCTIPATIPITKDVLRTLQNPETLANYNQFKKTLKATLEAGFIHKSGQLVIDSFTVNKGMDVSFAEKNSDLYATYKEKTLTEIFDGEKEEDITLEDFGSVEDCMNHLHNVYTGAVESNFCLFPVLVNRKEVDSNETFEILNNPDPSIPYHLIWKSRIIAQDDVNIWVPDGYGISPFFIMHKFINVLLEKIGYKVVYNDFAIDSHLKKLSLINNCADAICKGRIKYSDLVPDCTFGEFFDFLENKFGAGLFFNDTKNEISVVLFQNILSHNNNFFQSLDISDLLNGEISVRVNESSRIILQSDTGLEGAKPASPTLDNLLEKYKYYAEVNESEFPALENYNDVLVLRKSTGVFYELQRHYGTTEKVLVRIGTNYFNFDRKNSKLEEKKETTDKIPPMFRLPSNYLIAPYIGDSIHKNTVFGNKENNNDTQSIILSYFGFKSSFSNFYYGTTQKYDMNGNLSLPDIYFDLTNEDIHTKYFSRYNELLLNGLTTIVGNFLFNIFQLSRFSMERLVLFKNQSLLPKLISYEIGKKIKCNDSEFILVKNFNNMVVDVKPKMILSRLRWMFRSLNIQNVIDEIKIRNYWEGNIHFFDFNVTHYEEESSIYNEPFFLGIPLIAGVEAARANRNMIFYYTYKRSHVYDNDYDTLEGQETRPVVTWYESVPD